MRIPKLHGFKNRFRIEYEVVNLGRIAALVEAGVFEPGDVPGAKKAGKSGTAAPITVNQEILRAAGLVSTLKKPLKVLGNGDLSVALFVVADAFSRSAIAKIEAAGGSVQVLEVPSGPLAALGLDLPEPEAPEVAAPSPDSTTDAPVESRAVAQPDAAPKSGRPAKPAKANAPAARARSAKPAVAESKAPESKAPKPKAAVAESKAAKPKAAVAESKAAKPAKATGKAAPTAAAKATEPTDTDA
jgi:outer membrane biosynthesis protein TonB